MPMITRKRAATSGPQSAQANTTNNDLACDELSTVKLEDDENLDDFRRKTFESIFHSQELNLSEDESDYNDKKQRRKAAKEKRKKRLSKTQQYGPKPVAGDISDNENVKHDVDECPLSKLFHSKATPGRPNPSPAQTVVRVELKDKAHSLAVVDLFPNQSSIQSHSTMVTSTVTKLVLDKNVSGHHHCRSSHKIKSFKVGFLDLPWEIRVRVYRQLFVTNEPIVFHRRVNFSRTAALLSTCRLISIEGTEILYGENTFHFERTEVCRGNYFDREWPEIGFKDVRRFLCAVGSNNLAHFKSVSFRFTNSERRGAPADTIHDVSEFVNDPVLHEVLYMFANNTVLCELGLAFHGGGFVTEQNYYFLKALTSIRCYRLIHHKLRFARRKSAITDRLFDKVEAVMVLEEQDPHGRHLWASRLEKFFNAHPDHF